MVMQKDEPQTLQIRNTMKDVTVRSLRSRSLVHTRSSFSFELPLSLCDVQVATVGGGVSLCVGVCLSALNFQCD